MNHNVNTLLVACCELVKNTPFQDCSDNVTFFYSNDDYLILNLLIMAICISVLLNKCYLQLEQQITMWLHTVSTGVKDNTGGHSTVLCIKIVKNLLCSYSDPGSRHHNYTCHIAVTNLQIQRSQSSIVFWPSCSCNSSIQSPPPHAVQMMNHFGP